MGSIEPGAGPAVDAPARWVGIGAVALAALGFGLQGVLAKYASRGGASVPTMLAIRFAVATPLVWALLLALRARDRHPSPRQPPRRVLGFAVLGLLFVSSSLTYFLALERLPLGTAALLVYASPALVVLWVALCFGEPLTRTTLGALALALLGCALTVDPLAAFAAGASPSWAGVALALGSALSHSWFSTLAAPLGRGAPGLTVTAYSLPVAGLCCAAYVMATGRFTAAMSPGAWASCLAMGALIGGSVSLLLVGIGRLGASRAAIVATAEPAVAVLLGALLFAEPLTVMKLLGGACIAGGILVLSGRRAAGDPPPRT